MTKKEENKLIIMIKTGLIDDLMLIDEILKNRKNISKIKVSNLRELIVARIRDINNTNPGYIYAPYIPMIDTSLIK